MSHKAALGMRLGAFFIRAARFAAGSSLRALSFTLGFILVGSVALAALTTTWGPGLPPQAAPNTGNVMVPWTAANNMAFTTLSSVVVDGNQASSDNPTGIELNSQSGDGGSFIDFHDRQTPPNTYDWGARIWHNPVAGGFAFYARPQRIGVPQTAPDLRVFDDGRTGANQYCDINGTNCVTAAELYALVHAVAPAPVANTTTCSFNGSTVAQGQQVTVDETQLDRSNVFGDAYGNGSNSACGLVITQKRQVTRQCAAGAMVVISQTEWKNDTFDIQGTTGISMTSSQPSWSAMDIDGRGSCNHAAASIPAGTTYTGQASFCASCGYASKDFSVSNPTGASLTNHVVQNYNVDNTH